MFFHVPSIASPSPGAAALSVPDDNLGTGTNQYQEWVQLGAYTGSTESINRVGRITFL